MSTFFIQLNIQEIGAIYQMSHAENLAYLFLKQNTDFQRGTTKKISFGGLAGMLGIAMKKPCTRTDASRLICKLIKKEIIEETEVKQVYRFKLCEKFDTITLNINKKEIKNNHHTARTREDEDFSGSGKQGRKTADTTATAQTADKGASAPVKAALPPSILKGKGEGAETAEAAQIRAHAKAEGWAWCDNPKSLPHFKAAGEASKKLTQPLAGLLAEYQSSESDHTAMGFKIWVINYAKATKRRGLNAESQYRGDLVL